jgi:hypothetical protein
MARHAGRILGLQRGSAEVVPEDFRISDAAARQRAKQESLAEMQRSHDGRQVNFDAQIVIATGLRG